MNPVAQEELNVRPPREHRQREWINLLALSSFLLENTAPQTVSSTQFHLRSILLRSGISLLSLLLLSVFGLNTAHAAFQMESLGARSSAMGGGGIAFSDDSASLFLSPASFARVRDSEFSFMWVKPHAGLPGIDLNVGYLLGVIPTRVGNIGLGAHLFQGSGLLEEKSAVVSFSKSLLRRKLNMGASLKYLHHGYNSSIDSFSQNDPVFANGTSKGGVAIDLGANFQAHPNISLGITVKNLNEPDLGLASEDRVQRKVSLGIGVKVGGLRLAGDVFFKGQDLNRGNLLSPQISPLLPVPLSLGTEYKLPGNTLSVRAGVNPTDLSAGFGINLGNTRLDYSVLINQSFSSDSYGTHRLGVTLAFGKAASRRSLLSKKSAEEAPSSKAKGALKAR